MSTVVTTKIRCDRCQEEFRWVEEGDGRYLNDHEMRSDAIGRGWETTYIPGGTFKDVCRDCLEKAAQDAVASEVKSMRELADNALDMPEVQAAIAILAKEYRKI